MAQYIARNVDNTPKVPQPGDVEVQDVFTNVFDNFNEYGTNPGQVRFYNVENTLKSPQPLYQNGNYKRYIVQYTYNSNGQISGVNNVLDPNQPQPDALDWIDRNVENQVITPEPYVPSPLWPDGAPSVDTSAPGSNDMPIALSLNGYPDGQAVLVHENDISSIHLVGVFELLPEGEQQDLLMEHQVTDD